MAREGSTAAVGSGFALFATAIGRCGIAWGGRGITGLQLPEARVGEARARLRQRFPGAREGVPTPEVRDVVDRVAALLAGTWDDLASVPLDMEGVPPFPRRVYQLVRTIPPGETLSYGEVAAEAGSPGGARAVGQALGRNPFPIVVPCHRVLAAGGRVGGFTATGGVATKRRMLAIESVHANGMRALDRRGVVDELRAADPALGALIDRVGPFTMEVHETPGVFGALARAIVHQQLSTQVASTIHGRLAGLFPPRPGGFSPADVLGATDEQLRGAGLSGSKVRSLRDLAVRAEDGRLPTLAEAERMDDDAIVQRLVEVRGIGRWSAEMFLMSHLGRPDVLPVDDYGIRKGCALLMGRSELPLPREVARRGERWRPYRTVASWYLWRALDL